MTIIEFPNIEFPNKFNLKHALNRNLPVAALLTRYATAHSAYSLPESASEAGANPMC